MKRAALDIYDDMPRYMKKYISNYGWHFNKAACEYAVKLMKDRSGSKMVPFTKDKLDVILKNNNIEIEDNVMYDYIFTANIGKSKYYGSSIKDERSLALFIKDTIDGHSSSNVFRMWLSNMIESGNPVDWEELC